MHAPSCCRGHTRTCRSRLTHTTHHTPHTTHHTTHNTQHTTHNTQHTTNNKQPTTNNQQPTTNNTKEQVRAILVKIISSSGALSCPTSREIQSDRVLDIPVMLTVQFLNKVVDMVVYDEQLRSPTRSSTSQFQNSGSASDSVIDRVR